MILFVGDYAAESSRCLSKRFISILKNVEYVILNYEGTSITGTYKEKLAKGYAPIVDDLCLREFIKNSVKVVCCLTNNHTGDYGKEGYKSTVNSLLKLGCIVVGKPIDNMEILPNIKLNLNGSPIKIWTMADFNVGEVDSFFDQGPKPRFKNIFSSLKREKNKTKHINICYYHAGVEFLKVPNPSLVKNVAKLYAVGTDHCFIHHQHVPLPVVYDDYKLTAYGLGNFAFDCFAHKKHHDTDTGLAVGIDSDNRCFIYDVFDNGVEIDIVKNMKRLEKKEKHMIPISLFNNQWSKAAFNRLTNKDIKQHRGYNNAAGVAVNRDNSAMIKFKYRIGKVISMLRQKSERDVLVSALYYFIKTQLLKYRK